MKSTSVAVKVDEDQSPLPHVLDIKTGTKFLVDTGAEVSIVRPTRIDQSFKSYDRSLFAANHSPIATYGNICNCNCNYILFTKLPWPGDSEGTFRSSSQAATCPPVYHTRRRLHTVPLIAERQAGKL